MCGVPGLGGKGRLLLSSGYREGTSQVLWPIAGEDEIWLSQSDLHLKTVNMP